MTDEQLIEELSFPVYRRTSTVIFAPEQSPNSSSVEMVTIDPHDLHAVQDRDNAMTEPPACSSPTVSPVGAFRRPLRDQTRDIDPWPRRRSIWISVAGWPRRSHRSAPAGGRGG